MDKLDIIAGGKAFGNVAQRLLASGMNVNALRTNDTLRYDEWKNYDEAVVKAYQKRLVGIADLRSRGLVYNIADGLGTTVLQFEDQSDITDANMSMDGITRGDNDRPEYSMKYLPLPIIHKDFQINVRALTASRKGNSPLDTTMAELAALKVAQKQEKLLFQGSSSYAFGGGTIYGYIDFPNRNLETTVNWTSAVGADILGDVLSMKEKLQNDMCFGPYVIYVPTTVDTHLDDDFKANSDLTIRQRLLQVAGIADVKVSDFLATQNIIMVQMDSQTVRLVEGLPLTNVEWQIEGNMIFKFKVMTIAVPQLRADQAGNCGICHGSW